jgi:hypothetical protein
VVLSPDGFSGTAHAEDSDSDRFNYGFLEQYRDGFYIGTNFWGRPLDYWFRHSRNAKFSARAIF